MLDKLVMEVHRKCQPRGKPEGLPFQFEVRVWASMQPRREALQAQFWLIGEWARGQQMPTFHSRGLKTLFSTHAHIATSHGILSESALPQECSTNTAPPFNLFASVICQLEELKQLG